MRLWLLNNGADIRVGELIDEITHAIGRRLPNGDDVNLISKIIEGASESEYVEGWRLAMGSAPSVEEVGRALAADDEPEEWMRAYFWLPLLPRISTEEWRDACSVIAAKYGALKGDYLRREEPPEITVGPVGSPFDREELEAMVPMEAATTIGAWRPGGDLWVSARELARTLEEVVKDNPQGWVREPVAVAMKLTHPIYIQHYLRAVAVAIKNTPIPVDKTISLIALVREHHPWKPVALGHRDFDYDGDWSRVDRATIDVIRASRGL